MTKIMASGDICKASTESSKIVITPKFLGEFIQEVDPKSIQRTPGPIRNPVRPRSGIIGENRWRPNSKPPKSIYSFYSLYVCLFFWPDLNR